MPHTLFRFGFPLYLRASQNAEKSYASLQLENQLSELLRTGAIRIDDLKKLTRNSAIKKYLTELGKTQRA